jgi:hypothetical protein
MSIILIPTYCYFDPTWAVIDLTEVNLHTNLGTFLSGLQVVGTTHHVTQARRKKQPAHQEMITGSTRGRLITRSVFTRRSGKESEYTVMTYFDLMNDLL